MNKKKRKLKRMRKKYSKHSPKGLLSNLQLAFSASAYRVPIDPVRTVKCLNKVLKHKLVLTSEAKKETRRE